MSKLNEDGTFKSSVDKFFDAAEQDLEAWADRHLKLEKAI